MLSAQEKLSKEEKERREKNIQAGNPFAQFGYKAKIATLSKGKYLEFHDLDSIVTIGTVRWHVYKNEIVERILQDSLNPDAQPIGDRAGRWISPDPLSEEFSDWSPYTFVYNSPIKYTDPTGMAPEECCPELVKAFKGIYGSVKSEVVGTYNFVTSDAYKSSTWKGAGNLLLGGLATSGPTGNIGNAYALDAKFGTNTVGALDGYSKAMDGFVNDLTSGDTQKTAGAITAAALIFAPSKLDDIAKIGKIGKIDISDANKVERSILDPPTKHGNAPTFKNDGASVEIHHIGQNPNGPFSEMHPKDHRGGENFKKNHPVGQTPLTKEQRKDFNKSRKEYWKKEYPKK